MEFRGPDASSPHLGSLQSYGSTLWGMLVCLKLAQMEEMTLDVDRSMESMTTPTPASELVGSSPGTEEAALDMDADRSTRSNSTPSPACELVGPLATEEAASDTD